MTNRLRVTQLIAGLAETFRRDLSDAGYEGYWRGLRDLPVEAVERACDEALRSSKFMPSCSELRQWAGEETADDRAIRAWEAVDRAAIIGAYKSPSFDCPIINATIRNLGGWPVILEKGGDEWHKWLRKDFLAVYASFYRSGVSGDACRRLQGLAEDSPEDIATGLPGLPEPVQRRIGQAPRPVDSLTPRIEFQGVPNEAT